MLGDDLLAVLPELRAHARSMMTETVRVTRVTGKTFDRNLGRDVETTAEVYSGPGRLKSGGSWLREETAAMVSWSVDSDELHLPVETSGACRPGDSAEVLVSAVDASLEGRTFVLRMMPAHSLATARRFRVEEVLG